MSTTPELPLVIRDQWVIEDSKGRLLVNWMDNTIWYTGSKESAEALVFQLNQREEHAENKLQCKALELIKVYPQVRI